MAKKVRKTEYNDGENVTHYLGNDDYSGNDLPDLNEIEENPMLEGKVALGNELKEDDLEENASPAEKATKDQLKRPDQEQFLE